MSSVHVLLTSLGLCLQIGDAYKGLDLSLDCFPADDVEDDPEAYLKVCGRLRGQAR